MYIKLSNATIALENKEILTGVNFHVSAGEFVYIIGKVGSGKSSLMKTLYGELPIKADEAEILDVNLKKLKRKNLPALRKQLGIVFQDFQLLSDRTVHKNLDFVLRATGWRKRSERKARIQEVLDLVGMQDKENRYPHELSGGEQQRIAIARALLNKPRLILADEPTGNLDFETGKQIINLLRSICEKDTAVVMITHNLALLQSYPGIVYRCQDASMAEVTKEYNNPICLTEEEDSNLDESL
jgi:cell division transport system ATP-binding protein